MRFLPLRSYSNYITAHLRLHQLEEEHIRVVLQGEHASTIGLNLTNVSEGIRLMVADVQWERADAILKKIEATEPQPE